MTIDTARKPVIRHGHATGKYSPTFQSWKAMKSRVKYRNRPESKYYEGISICDRWALFTNFLEDMGERPQGKTLDRIDRKGNYEPGNCRWATRVEQNRNRRNVVLNFDKAKAIAMACLSGETFEQIAARFGCCKSLPREIYKGRIWVDALTAAHALLPKESDNG